MDFLTLLSFLPVVDVFANGISTSPGPFIYDMAQVVGGLQASARVFKWISDLTPWEADDKLANKWLGMTTSAVEFVASLAGALNTPKK